MINEIRKRHPDYSFGRITAANSLLHQKRYDEVLTVLRPLLQMERLHITEASGLYSTMIELHLCQGNMAEAESFLWQLEEFSPQHPNLNHFRSRLKPSNDVTRQ